MLDGKILSRWLVLLPWLEKMLALFHWSVHKIETKTGSGKWVGGWGRKNSQTKVTEVEKGHVRKWKSWTPLKRWMGQLSSAVSRLNLETLNLQQSDRSTWDHQVVGVPQSANFQSVTHSFCCFSWHGMSYWKTLKATLLTHWNWVPNNFLAIIVAYAFVGLKLLTKLEDACCSWSQKTWMCSSIIRTVEPWSSLHFCSIHLFHFPGSITKILDDLGFLLWT